MAARARAFRRVVVDVGTGDGRYPLFVARTQPETFVIGIEPTIDALRTTARAVARRPLANVALIVSTVEAASLGPVADLVTVHFPWGPLLAAALGEAPAVLASIAALAKPGAPIRMLVSATERDGRARFTHDALAALAPGYATVGLTLTTVRPATRADVDAARSTWGKRVRAGATRPAFMLESGRALELSR